MQRLLAHNAILILLVGILLTVGMPAFADEIANFVTYGPQAGTQEGDDDFTQVFYFYVPADVTDSLWLRIYDPDCGGNDDSRYYKLYDTQTRFAFYGGESAATCPGCDSPNPSESVLTSGKLLYDHTFKDEPFIDKTWQPVVQFSPSQGEEVDGKRAFKLVVQGVAGDDANIYNVELSRKPKRSEPVSGVSMITYAPTIRLPWRGVFAEMKFRIPDSIESVTVHNFDLTGADMTVETKYRSSLVVAPSGQDEWIESTVELIEREKGVYGALAFEGGEEMPNDATFYVTTNQGKTLPIELPIRLRVRNHRPEIAYKIEPMADCRSMMLDASRTVDKDRDPMQFTWFFGDSATATGMRTTFDFGGPGDYYVELLVSDESGHVGNSSRDEILVHVNYPPVADAGIDLLTPPRQPLGFNASASSDADRDSLIYTWSFGDGEYGEGEKTVHSYENPGKYTVVLKVEDTSGHPCNNDSDTLTVTVNAAPILNIGADRTASPGDTLIFTPELSQDLDGVISVHRWDMGDGTVLEGQQVQYVYDKSGKYFVICTVEDDAATGNSVARDTMEVHVNNQPVAVAGSNKVGSAREELEFDGTASFDRDGRIVSYQWDFGDGYVKIGPRLTHVYAKPGEYRVALSVMDDSKTSTDTAIDSIVVRINEPPVAVPGNDTLVTSSQLNFDGSRSYDPDGEIVAYLWDFGDGRTSEEASPIHTYRNPGVFTITLTVTDNSGTSTNKTSAQMNVEVNHQPLADAGANQVVAPGQQVHFDGTASIDPDGEIICWEWDYGDGTTSLTDAAPPETEEKIPDSSEVVVPDTVAGITDTTVSVSDSVAAEPEPMAEPNLATVSSTSKIKGTPTPVHVYDKPGSYTVMLTVRDNTCHEEAWGIDETYVVVNEAPIANAGGDRSSSPDVEMTFNARRSYDPDGELVAFYWDFSDGEGSAQGAKIKRSFERGGLYTATLTVVDNAGVANSTAQDRIEILINSSPISKPGPDIETCQMTLTFDGSASMDPDGQNLLYTWDFGDDSPSERGVKVTHTFKRGGKYPVTLTVDDGAKLENSVAVSSLIATINQPPVANAGGSINSCAGEMIFFDGSYSIDPEGGPLKYFWDFGDGTQARGVNPAKRYERGGTYQVVLTVEDASGLECNRASDQITVDVGESPVADAGPDIVACANTEIRFDGTRSYDSDGLVNEYHWDFGDGSTMLGPTPTHTYKSAGEYRVLLNVTGDRMGECDNTSTDEVSVTIYEAPAAIIEVPELLANKEPVTFNGGQSTSGGAEIISYEWNLGDGTRGEGDIVSHTYEKWGVYYASLTVTTSSKASCNRSVAQQVVTVNARPDAQAGEDHFVGIGEEIIFDATASKDTDGTITRYEWDFGDGARANNIRLRKSYAQSGEYIVLLHVTDNTDVSNNWDMDTVVVTVNPTPEPTIVGPRVACAGEELSFHDATGAEDLVAWKWDMGDGTKAEGRAVSHSFKRPGMYLVSLIVDDGKQVGNSKVQTVKVVLVNTPPIPYAGKDFAISPKEKATFDGSISHDPDGLFTSYQWNFGDGTGAEGMVVTHEYEKTGLYTAVLTVTDNSGTICATVSDTVMVEVNTSPVVEVGSLDRIARAGGADEEILFDARDTYDPDGNPLTYAWDFGDGTTGTGSRVRHAFAKTGVYRVKLTVDDGTGLDSGTVITEIIVKVKER